MKFAPSNVPAQTSQQLAEYLRREFQRVANSIDSLNQDGWTDEKFPASGINLAGTPSPPTIDSTWSANSVPGTLLFSGSAQNNLAGVAQFKHGFVSGPVGPHMHVRREVDSAEGVVFYLAYNILGNPGDKPTGWVTLSGTVVAGDFTSAYEHCIIAFPAIDLTSYYDSVMVGWHLWRDGASDSFADVVRLYEFDIHYRNRAFGSTNIYAQ
jgi:hypothetical protein